MRRAALAVAALVAAVTPGACGGDSGADLTVYSGRNEQLVGPLLERFERESGLDVDVRYGDSAELSAAIAEEGEGSPADVFFSQDAGALGAIEGSLEPLPGELLAPVPERFRDPGGRWVGVSGRARVLASGTEGLEEGEVPDSVFDLTSRRWRGRFGLPPTNASFQAFVSGMRLAAGDERTRRWLEDIEDNDPELYENNIQTVEAIDRGEIDVGLVNHYYVYELRREQPDLKVRNHFLRSGDPGSLVNAAGAGILRTSDEDDAARRFVRFLLSPPAQRYFVDHNGEYPLAPGARARADLPPLARVQGPDVRLGELGGKLRSTLEMLDEVGLTR
jgi:iron(III) transport system substrate-binding protein